MGGGVLAMAYALDFMPELNFNYMFESRADPCPPYPATTHVVTAAGIGGLTRDGVNDFRQNQFDIFDIRMRDNSPLPKDGSFSSQILTGTTSQTYASISNQGSLRCSPPWT